MTPVKSYYPDGTLESEGFLLNNVQVGDWTFYHEDGELFTKGKFDNSGSSVGVWTEYYLNGQKKYEAISEQGNHFSLDDENLQLLNYWTEDGQYLIREGQGTLTIYNEVKNIKHKSFWSDNLKNGTFQEFYVNGNLKVEWNFRNGLRDGDAKTFHANGNPYIHCFYEKGKAIGSYTEWDESRQLIEEGFYRNEEYFVDNFWNKSGVQILCKGSGYIIRRFGADELDIYKQEFTNYTMTNETRL